MVLLGEEAQSGRLEIVLILTRDGCTVGAECTIGYVGHVESCFGPFGDRTSIGARWVHGLHQLYHGVRNHFGRS